MNQKETKDNRRRSAEIHRPAAKTGFRGLITQFTLLALLVSGCNGSQPNESLKEQPAFPESVADRFPEWLQRLR